MAIVAETRNPLVSLILSLVIPGVGQVYNGEVGKGIAFIVLAFVFLFLTIFLIGIPLYLVLWLYAMYDAYKGAERFNAVHAGQPYPMPMGAPAPPPPGYVPPPPSAPPPGAGSPEVVCPTCGLRFTQGQARYCPKDATPLRAVA